MRRWTVTWERSPNNYSQWHTRAVSVIEVIERWELAHESREVSAIMSIWESGE